MQGCEWEFKKRAEIVLKTQKMAWKHKKRHILGYFNNKKRAEISFKAELSHPWTWTAHVHLDCLSSFRLFEIQLSPHKRIFYFCWETLIYNYCLNKWIKQLLSWKWKVPIEIFIMKSYSNICNESEDFRFSEYLKYLVVILLTLLSPLRYRHM